MSELFEHHPEAGAPAQPSRFSRLRQWALGLLVFVIAALGLALLLLPVPEAKAQTRSELRIGYQKSASLFVLQKAQGTLEKKLAPLGFGVKWVEFPAGPQLLEGLNVGAVDVGYVGEAPPIFAQAAGAQFVYFGFDPAAPRAEAILVTKDSPIKSVADLKGKKVALNKGSNVHYLLVKQLEKHGLKLGDIQPVYLAPADGRAAFESRNVDAWVIWDPFLAAAQAATGARTLADGEGLVVNTQFFLAERSYAEANKDLIRATLDELRVVEEWAVKDVKAAAAELAPAVGIPAPILEVALGRQSFGVQPITPEVVAQQQKIADVFLELKLLPKPISIADAVVEVNK